MDDTRILTDRGWQRQLEEFAQALNSSFREQDHEAGRAARAELLRQIEVLRAEHPPALAEIHLKNTRNELIRLNMAHGWYAEAEEVSRQAMVGLDIDHTCPNREAILAQTLARVQIESGDLAAGRVEIKRAAGLSSAFLELLTEGWSRFPARTEGPQSTDLPPPQP